MFVDKAEIFVRSGKGGDGAVSFRREKYVPDGGPDGGDGGKGGSVIVVVDEGMRTLMDFRYKRKYIAEPGENGKKKNMFGKDSEDLYLKVPEGTIIKDKETGLILADLTDKDSRYVAVRGGRGGKGNTHFKNSVRQAPTFSQQGQKGQERVILLELKMLADVGLVGFPNVGKSTLLSSITKAKPKIANYHFTTLKPNLGVVEMVKGKSFVLADIPGLIEGAHEGIGLGHEFLRHVERTKLIIHVVDISGIEGRDAIEDFDLINQELEKYNEVLSKKKQIVVANKADILFETDRFDAFKKEMTSRGYDVYSISAATGQGVEELMLQVTEELDHIEDVVLYEPVDEHTLYEMVEDKSAFDIKVEGEVFFVTGDSIDRIVFSTDFESIESLRRFQSILGRMGVFDGLREAGIDDGDTVNINGFEFDYFE